MILAFSSSRVTEYSNASLFILATSIVYSQTFTNGVTPSSQCSAWNTFAAQLTVRNYTFLAMRGSQDSIGVTVTDPSVIAGIALALRTSTAYGPVTSNGRSWAVASCSSVLSLSASGSACSCTAPVYILRPCTTGTDWGGLNGSVCTGPTQNITVTFQY